VPVNPYLTGVDNAVHIAALEALKAENATLLKRALAAEKETQMYREQMLQQRHELDQLKRLVYVISAMTSWTPRSAMTSWTANLESGC